MSRPAMLAIDDTADASTEPRSPLMLPDAIAALRSATERGDGDAIDLAIAELEIATPSPGLQHGPLCEAGRAAADAERWLVAESFAMRSLISFPKYGAALRLLGDTLVARQRDDEAATCYRYQLPDSIEQAYLDALPCERVTSDDATDAGVQRLPAYPAETYALTPPFQLHATDVPELSHRSLTSAEAFVGRVPGGQLWYDGGNAVAWDRQGRLIDDISIGFPRVVHASVQQRTPVRLEGRVCLLGNRSFTNYYHWMTDTLPRLAVLQAAGIALDSIDRFVVTPLKHGFHESTLATLGIAPEQLHTIDRGEYVEADELFVPIFGSNSLGLRQGAWNPAFLNRAFGPSEAPAERGRRLFISRGTTGKRGIVNEEAVLDALAPYGFERVLCENHTVEEQAQMFAEADVVVGPHGAGLTNIAFCQPDTIVLELFNAHMAACFWTISELTGLRHAIQFCGVIDEQTGLPGSATPLNASAMDIRRNAFHVEPSELLATLAALEIAPR